MVNPWKRKVDPVVDREFIPIFVACCSLFTTLEDTVL